MILTNAAVPSKRDLQAENDQLRMLLGKFGYKRPEEYLPLPDLSLYPYPINATYNAVVEKLNDNVYLLVGGGYLHFLIDGNKGLTLIDCPIFSGFLTDLISSFGKPVTKIIYSHHHHDHIGFCKTIVENEVSQGREVKIYASDGAKILSELPNELPVPTNLVKSDDDLKVSVGDDSEVILRKPKYRGHSPSDLVVYIPEVKLIILVDSIFPSWVPFRRLALAENLVELLKGISDVYNIDFEWEKMSGGHFTKLGTREDVQIYVEFVQDLIDAILESGNHITFHNFGANLPAFFYDFYNQLIFGCHDIVLPKWKNRLAALDVFLYDNCDLISTLITTETSFFRYVISLSEGKENEDRSGLKKRMEESTKLREKIGRASCRERV